MKYKVHRYSFARQSYYFPYVLNIFFKLTSNGSMEKLLAEKLELGHIQILDQLMANKKYKSYVNVALSCGFDTCFTM